MAQTEALTQTIRDFELSGVGLEGEAKQRYGEISARLSELGSTFGENVLDATRAWSKLITDEAELVGLPESALAQAQANGPSKGARRLVIYAGLAVLPAGYELRR